MGRIKITGAMALLFLIYVSLATGLVAGVGNVQINGPYHSGDLSQITIDGIKEEQNPGIKTHSDITVCNSGCDYTNIQEAINGSSFGDTIQVFGGIYPESVNVNKSVTIQGVNGTAIVGNKNRDYAIQTSSDLVVLQNLSFAPVKKNTILIKGNLTGLIDLNCSGQNPEDSMDAVVTGKDVTGIILGRTLIETTGRYGISGANLSGVFVYNNTITVGNEPEQNNMAIDFSYAKLGETGSYYYVFNNTLNRGGISVYSINKQGEKIVYPEMDKIQVIQNRIKDATWQGIDIGGMSDDDAMHIHNATISDNQITGAQSSFTNLNVRGISKGTFTNNTVRDFPVDGEGIVLSDLDSFTIKDNQIMNGTVNWIFGYSGFLIQAVRNSVITNNTVSNVSPFSFNYAPGIFLSPNLTFDSTNTADGKPVVYREKIKDQVIDSQNAAMIILTSCTNTTVYNCTVKNTGIGIGVYNGTGIQVINNQIIDSNTGMMLIESSGTLARNNSFQHAWMGLGIGNNNDTEIRQNNFSSYTDSGIVLHLGKGKNINITNNSFQGDFSGKDQAIAIMEANGVGVSVANNTITHNTRGILVVLSLLFTIKDNLIQDCGIGMNLLGAQENQIHGNRILNTDKYSEGLYVISSDANGAGPCLNNTFVNNYVQSVKPVNVSTIHKPFTYSGVRIQEQWGNAYEIPVLNYSEEETYPNVWNISKTPGKNIVNGSFLGGNFYGTPTGTGWSQTHPDRGDGFTGEPNTFNADNVDFLPLHLPGTPTPTPTPTLTPTPTPTSSPTPTPTLTPSPTPTPGTLIANFTAVPVTGTPPLKVYFSDNSTGNPTKWNWTFGDGTLSHEQNPVHTYTGIGRYTITLEISNKFGQSVMQKSTYITPNAGRVIGPNGMIQVTSNPDGADVSVDEIRIGKTPLQSTGIPAGLREIRVSMDGYREWKGTFLIKQGELTLVPKVNLRKTN